MADLGDNPVLAWLHANLLPERQTVVDEAAGWLGAPVEIVTNVLSRRGLAIPRVPAYGDRLAMDGRNTALMAAPSVPFGSHWWRNALNDPETRNAFVNALRFPQAIR